MIRFSRLVFFHEKDSNRTENRQGRTVSILCGTKTQSPGYRFRTDQYDQWQVIAVLDGELGITVRETDTSLGPGCAALLPVGSRFGLWCRGQGYRGAFAILRNSTDPDLAGTARALDVTARMASVAEIIGHETRQPGPRSEQCLAAAGRLLAELTLRAGRRSGGQESYAPAPDYWVARARPLVERSIYSATPLKEVLRGLGISYRQLTRHFRTVLDTTPKQHQLRCRLREARRLLRETDLSVTSIALELGFSSSQHFSARFASRHDCPPSRWRKSNA
jgi:AraC-like DNA-binding protein